MIPFEDKMLGLAMGIVVCAIFVYVVCILAKKERAKND